MEKRYSLVTILALFILTVHAQKGHGALKAGIIYESSAYMDHPAEGFSAQYEYRNLFGPYLVFSADIQALAAHGSGLSKEPRSLRTLKGFSYFNFYESERWFRCDLSLMWKIIRKPGGLSVGGGLSTGYTRFYYPYEIYFDSQRILGGMQAYSREKVKMFNLMASYDLPISDHIFSAVKLTYRMPRGKTPSLLYRAYSDGADFFTSVDFKAKLSFEWQIGYRF